MSCRENILKLFYLSFSSLVIFLPQLLNEKKYFLPNYLWLVNHLIGKQNNNETHSKVLQNFNHFSALLNPRRFRLIWWLYNVNSSRIKWKQDKNRQIWGHFLIAVGDKSVLRKEEWKKSFLTYLMAVLEKM